MPKITRTPQEVVEMERFLRKEYGGLMTRSQIGKATGHMNNHNWQTAFVADLSVYLDGKRKKYKAIDVARKICEMRVT